VTISWTNQATLGSPSLDSAITYRVQRGSDGGGYAPIENGPCAGSLPHGTTSCTDTVALSGTYTYQVIAKFGSWSAASNETAVTATVPAATTTTLASSQNPSVVGEQVTYTATVTTTKPGPAPRAARPPSPFIPAAPRHQSHYPNIYAPALTRHDSLFTTASAQPGSTRPSWRSISTHVSTVTHRAQL
jgi:hypothetical protein